MTGYSIDELARILSGKPLVPLPGHGPPAGPAGSIDTRSVEGGEIFFALPGGTTDGHFFVAEAFRKGAAAAIVRHDRSDELPADVPRSRIVAVADPEAALAALARARRAACTPRVVAVTGSNGKTTTKELIAALLAEKGPTLSSRGNNNTPLGLALTLLRLDRHHRWAVLELGISEPGEMARLAALARPSVAVITNVHGAHLEGLGSVENVAREKCSVAASLEEPAVTYVNGDDPVLLRELTDRGIAHTTFGLGERCAFRPVSVDPWNAGGIGVTLAAGEAYRVDLYGEPNVQNLLAALAVARDAGLGPRAIARGLGRFTPPPRRFSPSRVGGVLLVDDTYNANLASTLWAIRFLEKVETEGRRIFLFGDMRELGDREETDHRAAGRAAAEAGVDGLYLFGKRIRWTAEEAVAIGLGPEKIVVGEGDRRAFGARIAGDLRPGDCLVAKGSRATRVDEILDAVRGSLARASAEGKV